MGSRSAKALPARFAEGAAEIAMGELSVNERADDFGAEEGDGLRLVARGKGGAGPGQGPFTSPRWAWSESSASGW